MAISNIHHRLSFTGSLPFRKVKMSEFDRKQGRYSFARGFLVCKAPDLAITPHFTRQGLTGGYHLYCHEMLQVESAGDMDAQAVIILGPGLWAS